MNELEIKVLDEIKIQIGKFDSKANTLLAIAGIILSFSFFWIEILKKTFNVEINTIKIFLIIFIFFYLTALSLSIIFFLLVNWPYKKPKKFQRTNSKYEKSVFYYNDLAKMDENEIEEKLTVTNESWIKQIQINAKIANTKHIFLRLGIITLFLSILFLLVSIIFYLI